MTSNLEAGARGPGYYKTTITIYSEFDPSTTELTRLAQEATDGMAICTGQTSEVVLAKDLPDEAASFFVREDDTETVLTLDSAGRRRAVRLADEILSEPGADEREKHHEERRQEAMFELANLIIESAMQR
jgi:hypothetical protein